MQLKKFSEGVIGLASSCLTADIEIIKRLLAPLHEKNLLNNVGWITTKTLVPGQGDVQSRIIHLDYPSRKSILPKSLICRGKNEWLDKDQLIKLTKELRELFVLWDADIKIKVSLPGRVAPHRFPELINELVKKGAEFDAIEIPLKYLQKNIQKKMNNPLSLDLLQEATIEQYGAALAILAFLKLGLKTAKRSDVPVFLKLSIDNWVPDIMSLILLCPSNPRMLKLTESLKDQILRHNQNNLPEDEVYQMALTGASAIVLFDSEKMPIFLPDLNDPRSAFIPNAEGGYSLKGGAIVGKAIAKDSLKHIFQTGYHLAVCGEMHQGRLISSGGCDSGIDVASRLILGASGVDLCTILIREGGNGLVRIINEFNDFLAKTNQTIDSLIGLARQTSNIAEIYNPLNFKKEHDCICQNCSAFCWKFGVFVKDCDNWPPDNNCVECASCITLCQMGNLRASSRR